MLANLIPSPFTYKPHVGDKWSLVYNLPPATMMPNMTDVEEIKKNDTQLQDIINGLNQDVKNSLIDQCKNKDFNSYSAGKIIAKSARTASISRAFGTEHHNNIDTQIQKCLEFWLRIDDKELSDEQKFHYEPVWGGIINSQNSFGFSNYSDHHFHLGYWLYAAAYYVKYHIPWAKQNIKQILYLARDVGNPSTKGDPYYGPVRHKDMYLGQSWASGVQIGVRDQESSSEAINCYHGLAALGDALIEVDKSFSGMRDFGRIWLAMEIKSVKQYYQVRDDNFHQFPPLIQNFGNVGIFSEFAIYKYTLFFPCDDPNVFPRRHACLKGIQVLPVTAISHLVMDQQYAKNINTTCQWAINPLTAPNADKIQKGLLTPTRYEWGVFCLVASSAVSQSVTQQAIDYVHNKPPGQDLDSGAGLASTLLFLYGRT